MQGCTLAGLRLTPATWRLVLGQPPQPERDLAAADPQLCRSLQCLRQLVAATASGSAASQSAEDGVAAMGLHFAMHDALGREVSGGLRRSAEACRLLGAACKGMLSQFHQVCKPRGLDTVMPAYAGRAVPGRRPAAGDCFQPGAIHCAASMAQAGRLMLAGMHRSTAAGINRGVASCA